MLQFTKKISEDHDQHHPKALELLETKALAPELIKPLNVEDVELNLESPYSPFESVCGVNPLMTTSLAGIPSHCRYHTDGKQQAVRMLQLQEKIKINIIKGKE